MNKAMLRKQTKTLAVAVVMFLCSGLMAQVEQHVPSDNRGTPVFRRKSNMDGNNLRATVFNFGFSGRTSARPDEFPYEWPKNTGRIYIALVAIWKAAEVTDEDGKIIQIVDFPTFRDNPSGGSWSLEPVEGFINPEANSIARSDNPDSWPGDLQGGWRDKREDPIDPGWVGSWNGFFGKNIFNADQEMFYRTSDDLYDRFNYIPDETDPSRGGLGMIMDVRALAWSQILISDVIFFIHDVLNDGTKRIPKTSFLIWIADIVGGDAQDDLPFVDLQTSVTFLTDGDRVGIEAFGGEPVGLGSVKFLETPGNQVDGIDNDGDADNTPEVLALFQGNIDEVVPLFTSEDFMPRTIGPGDKIVLIDSLTFERRVIAYPAGGGIVQTLGGRVNLPPDGITVVEDTLANLIDDDLDGLIDERETIHLMRFDEITNTVRPVRFINYLSFAIGDTIKRGFAVAGKSAEPSFQNVAPMIDESRDDGFDNDNDWNPFQDDVGLDGVEGSGDPGDGDGLITSGSGTDFPGEPNIDKTDVSETDLIGLTSALQDPEGGVQFNSVPDATVWKKFFTPGKFFLTRQIGQFDMYLSSGYFPIEPGQRQRMAISVAMAGGGQSAAVDIASAIRKQEQARTAFATDYQFAQAPLQVTVEAVPGDRRVTLYWDAIAEQSEDRFIKRLGGNPKDFEGYRIYRATDAAFLDSRTITDGNGVPTLLRPIAQFDLKDGISGFHPVDINGIKFSLGTDSGLKHSFIDTNVVNGQRYFYAVTAYDFGLEFGDISPTETSIKVTIGPEGDIADTGTNVAVVRPRASVAGYLPAGVAALEHPQGTSTGQVGFEILDPRAVQDGHTYQITFEDTLLRGPGFNFVATKNFTIVDLDEGGKVELLQSKLFNVGDEVPLIDGFRLSFINEERVKLDESLSGWSDDSIFDFQFARAQFLNIIGEEIPNDYQIIFLGPGAATSRDTSISFLPLPAVSVNFQIINSITGAPVPFAFAEIDGDDGRFSINPTNANRTDTIYLFERNPVGSLVYAWQVTLNTQPPDGRNPEAGDTLKVVLRKPFLSTDIYEFTMRGESAPAQQAKEQLREIRVVPNPYIAAASWEPRNTFSSGRGSRELHFINLPQRCTIRIFNVSGVLIDTIEHDSVFDNGTAIWDMLSRDNLDISYGLYIYHVEAPGIGQRTGNFAIIK